MPLKDKKTTRRSPLTSRPPTKFHKGRIGIRTGRTVSDGAEASDGTRLVKAGTRTATKKAPAARPGKSTTRSVKSPKRAPARSATVKGGSVTSSGKASRARKAGKTTRKAGRSRRSSAR
jgi:hypothetical protein